MYSIVLVKPDGDDGPDNSDPNTFDPYLRSTGIPSKNSRGHKPPNMSKPTGTNSSLVREHLSLNALVH